MKKLFPRPTIGTACLSLFAIACPAAQAQTGAPAATPTLKEIAVTGNPLGTTDLITPTTQYSGIGLLLRSKTTLGETLDGTPGISSSYFGPNASRPIIRGLDGDRIRILANGGGSLDASSLSYDHAVTSDPLTIERIEVLRGPAALLYGGSAVGGVVNVIDNRIPREAQFDEKGGISGKVDINAASGNSERSKGVLLEAGNQRYSLHVDAFDRQTSDVRVPRELPCTATAVSTRVRRICNSASDVSGGAVGGAVFLADGYLGASASNYRSTYGTVAEDQVTIGMKSDRYALEGEIRNLDGLLQSIKAQYSQTDYRHTEFESSRAGTVFTNKGSDFRLEARHVKVGNIDGVLGFQTESSRFSAVGTEAFAPFSKTSQSALFAFEELGTTWGKLSLGGRAESADVTSFGNPGVARFTPASRSFKPGSYALGALWNAAPGWQMTSNLAYSERAPKDYELFADGPHIATAAYEVGNVNLAKEQSGNLDLGAAWKSGAHSFKVNTYVSRFKNYISLNQTTGVTRNAEDGAVNPTEDPGNAGFTVSGAEFGPLAEFRYQQVRARFTGMEASGNIRLLEGASTVDLALRGDVVRATNLSNGQPLPRIAPWRVGASLLWGSGPWGASLGVDHMAAQRRVSAPPTGATPAYTLWNSAASYRVKAGAASLLWYARLDNMTDKLAYSATSVLTSTAFPKAPLPGRSLKVGLQASF
jgi:iron complex outermembrane receptor protein